MKKLLMKVNKNFIIFWFFVIFLILILLFYNGNNSNIIPEDTTANIETINLTGYNLVDVLSGDKFFIINKDTDEKIVYERDFWFAWYAFHPNTEVYNN